MKFGLQMYTVRDACETEKDFLHTLRAVKEQGYDGVELAGYHDVPAKELKAVLEELGLTVLASHESVERLEHELEEVLEYNHAIGNQNIVCAYSPASSTEELEKLHNVLMNAEKSAQKYGMHILYHNHSHEFNLVDGKRPIDCIKEYCMLELDTYWVFNSKVDVCDYIKANASRIGLIHLKDGGLDSNPCAIGEGKNDIHGIINTAKEAGFEWLIVENDNPTPDGLSDTARSIHHLKTKYNAF